jgi:hypothetical protein
VKRKTVPPPERNAAEILADRLGVPRKKLLDPEVKRLFDEHFREMRKIVDQPFDPVLTLSKPPGAVKGSRMANRESRVDAQTARRTQQR